LQESCPNSYAYTGREWDAEAGLYYYRARWYDSKIGRFMSEDPIGFESGDVNLFRYVGNSPINRIDPSGLVTIPPELRGLILEEIMDMVMVKGFGGLYAAACASSYCKRRATPRNDTDTGAECLSIISSLNLPLGHPLYGSNAYARECANECLRITHSDAFQQTCCTSK